MGAGNSIHRCISPNTGGQACTSGFPVGQVADMSPHGKTYRDRDPASEMGPIGMAHRTSFVPQSSMAHVTPTWIEGYIDRPETPGPPGAAQHLRRASRSTRTAACRTTSPGQLVNRVAWRPVVPP